MENEDLNEVDVGNQGAAKTLQNDGDDDENEDADDDDDGDDDDGVGVGVGVDHVGVDHHVHGHGDAVHDSHAHSHMDMGVVVDEELNAIADVPDGAYGDMVELADVGVNHVVG